MSIAAGTPAEASEIRRFYDALPQLLQRLALGVAPNHVPDTFDAAVLEALRGSLRCVLCHKEIVCESSSGTLHTDRV
jgi:hypothetical protein